MENIRSVVSSQPSDLIMCMTTFFSANVLEPFDENVRFFFCLYAYLMIICLYNYTKRYGSMYNMKVELRSFF